MLPPEELIFGRSPAMQRVRVALEQIGSTPIPVLLTGESGTGKEVIARLVHRRTAAPEPFVKVTCPAIPSTLLESELFGYEKGAFTGAHGNRPGRIEQAEGGTLFLDEIGELDLSLQAKLLQLLQDCTYLRVGGRKELQLQARLLFATNRRLEDEVAAGRFRRDLYYRVHVVGVELPPLRQRREDILALAEFFVDQFARSFLRPAPPFSSVFVRALLGYAWPGNVRELENMMKRYVVLGGASELLQEAALGAGGGEGGTAGRAGAGSLSLKALKRQTVLELERSVILHSLTQHHWHRKRTARALHISYRALLYKLKQTGIQKPDSAEPSAPPALGEEEI